MNNLYYLYKKNDSLIDDLVESWTDAMVVKLEEMDSQFGRQAAYIFYSRVCGHQLEVAQQIVDEYLDD